MDCFVASLLAMTGADSPADNNQLLNLKCMTSPSATT
jgi:hypothetical protein